MAWERFDLHVWVHSDPVPDPRIDQVLEMLGGLQPQVARIITMEEQAVTAAEDLAAEVDQVETVEESAGALLDKIFALLSEGATKEQVDASIADLRASRDALVAAVTRNTPAENPPPAV